jgi:anti-sigma factor RsiW
MDPGYEVDLSDEKLVAYIDGELNTSEQQMMAEALMHNAEARDRLSLLKQGGREFGAAFDLLLKAAPEARLRAMYSDILAGKISSQSNGPDGGMAGAENVVPLRGRGRATGTPFWQMAAAAAVLGIVFAGGMFAGGFFKQPPTVVVEGPTAEKPGWREAAARYVAMFSKETLTGMPAAPEQRQANLHSVETALGLKLEGERIAMPNLEFQGTQLLSFDGKPLAQIAYLHGDTPLALCIIPTENAPQGPAMETRHGLNIVHWIANGYGFMVIGGVPGEDLNKIAQEFQARLS